MRRLVFTAVSCAATACTYGSGKESYDLSAAAFSVVSAFSDGHTYFVSLCGDLSLTAAQLPNGACPAGGSVGVQLHRESGTCMAVGGPSSRGEGAAAKVRARGASAHARCSTDTPHCTPKLTPASAPPTPTRLDAAGSAGC
jgi:hypothetical protein